jgi:hypothetical protein
VALEHELSVARARVPELHASVLGARKHPVSVWSEGDGEDEVLDVMLELITSGLS